MQAFHTLTSTLTCLNWDGLDNNDLIPKLHAKRIKRAGSGEFLLNNSRYQPGFPRRERPDHLLNHGIASASQILIPGADFALTIDFEQVVWAILDAGYRVVISNQIGEKFKNFALKNGLVALEVSLTDLHQLEKLAGTSQVKVDLEKEQIVMPEASLPFRIGSQAKARYLNGDSEIDLTLAAANQALIDYEAKWNHFYQTK
ncbi:hypothetical protein AWM75_01655 [Aerococcus urinaehominis]|uniref:3-isopropylmalate dehydratase n=1 Tax=Aerococcus urinaehominis TaxID=128944 RepID=A0A0X8FK37_9LACT|nr:hypothetical protein [Aerococcus urinaehominis]AMB98776.1 hypothetical protein AWM75_01655 [Aerococcus urinaehominis]SDM13066.1 3-isopropylmalate/(R)-2-methylmalate dehydratase small subunit [Aerococcus urinaehominis]